MSTDTAATATPSPDSSPGAGPVLEMSGVSRTFSGGSLLRRTRHRAVVDVDLRVEPGRVLGLVGESGSGKSTLGRMAIGLIAPSTGSVRVLGEDLAGLSPSDLRQRRRRMQMIFQDSSNSLNPRMSLADLLMEPWRVQGLHTPADRRRRAEELADEVELSRSWLDRLPHEFSGGQRQRISIARALALEPALIVADEPVSALDVSVQARVLNLLKDIQRERDLALVFISHDMAVVEFISEDVVVLHHGEVVERGPAERVLSTPTHEYTRGLLAATPTLDEKESR